MWLARQEWRLRQAWLILPRAAATASSAASSETSQQRSFGPGTVAAVGLLGCTLGIAIGDKDSRLRQVASTTQSFRSCCEVPLSEPQAKLPERLQQIVGSAHVSLNKEIRGARIGGGKALAVVNPGTLQEVVDVVQACVDVDVALLPQGANTSLTGGACPRDTLCDRPTIVVNTRRLNTILPVGSGGEKVVCFAGAGIFDLKDRLEKEFKRDSHSVLGSIFLNPTVAAGICYGSGGTQIRKGPAFTDRALFLRVNEHSKVEVVDKLGLRPDIDTLKFLESTTSLEETDLDPKCRSSASWPDYPKNITKLDSEVSRFNADTRGLDVNRCEGKVMILATMHDSFAMPKFSRLVWVACKDFDTAVAIKKDVCIGSLKAMAKSCEYMDRDCFDVVDRAGRILIKVIDVLGMMNITPLWNLKLFIEALPIPFSKVICDKVLFWFNGIMPESLSADLMDLGRRYDHHMLMEFAEYGDGEVADLESRLKAYIATQPQGSIQYHICEPSAEAGRANLFRFVVAPAFRTYHIGVGKEGLSIDYALPKNFESRPELPAQYPMEKRVQYSHFGCNVYHEDIVFGDGVDVLEAKMAIKKTIEKLGGRLPAEHGHGTEYQAPVEAQQRWMKMDPTNALNPGVGGLGYNKGYATQPVHLAQ